MKRTVPEEFSEVHLISACYRPGCRAVRLCQSHRITSNKVTGFAVTRFNLLGTPGGPREGAGGKKKGNICKIAFLLQIPGKVGRLEVMEGIRGLVFLQSLPSGNSGSLHDLTFKIITIINL